MNATEQITALKIRPGAKPGQIILGVDLSETERSSQVLDLLTELGYEPQLRYLELRTGLLMCSRYSRISSMTQT
jgi:hypothetical protein